MSSTPTTTPEHDGTAPAGALTTIFTPPASCVTNTDLFYEVATCMPDHWQLYWNAASYYSPGICPSGLVSITTAPPFFGPPVEPGETAIVCCPPKYSLYASFTDHWCYGTVSYSDYHLIPITTTFTTSATLKSSVSYSSSYYNTTSRNTIYPIQVRWRQSDLAFLETNPLTPGAKPTDEGVSGPGGDSGDHGGKLSTGAIAGIAAGSVLFAIFAGCIIIIILIRRHRRQKLANRTLTSAPIYTPDAPMGGASIQYSQWQHDAYKSDHNESVGFIPTGNENVDVELRRIAERRQRLLELDEEEARLRQSANPQAELSSGRALYRPAELSSSNN